MLGVDRAPRADRTLLGVLAFGETTSTATREMRLLRQQRQSREMRRSHRVEVALIEGGHAACTEAFCYRNH